MIYTQAYYLVLVKTNQYEFGILIRNFLYSLWTIFIKTGSILSKCLINMINKLSLPDQVIKQSNCITYKIKKPLVCKILIKILRSSRHDCLSCFRFSRGTSCHSLYWWCYKYIWNEYFYENSDLQLKWENIMYSLASFRIVYSC